MVKFSGPPVFLLVFIVSPEPDFRCLFLKNFKLSSHEFEKCYRSCVRETTDCLICCHSSLLWYFSNKMLTYSLFHNFRIWKWWFYKKTAMSLHEYRMKIKNICDKHYCASVILVFHNVVFIVSHRYTRPLFILYICSSIKKL